MSKENIMSKAQKAKSKPKRAMSEGRQEKKMFARHRSQKNLPAYLIKHKAYVHQNSKSKIKELRLSKDSISNVKNSSLKSIKSEASLLLCPEYGLTNANAWGDQNSIISITNQPVQKESEENSYSLFGGNDVWPRKFSHINKLAQGLALNTREDIPFRFAPKEKDGAVTTNNPKLTTIKLKRNNSNNIGPSTTKSQRLPKKKIESADFQK